MDDLGKAKAVPGAISPRLEDEWRHQQECLQVTCCRDDTEVREGLRLIARVVREVYTEDGS